MSRPPRRSAGFTLLELLIALLVFVLLAALVYGLLRLGGRSWDAGIRRIDSADSLRIGWTLLHRTLGQAQPLAHQGIRAAGPQVEGTGLHFIGARDQLEWVAELPAALSRGGLHVLQIRHDTRGAALQLRAWPLTAGPLPDTAADAPLEAELAGGVTALTLRYLGDAGEQLEAAWQDTWAGEDQLPALIGVQVESRDTPPWPELLVRPLLLPPAWPGGSDQALTAPPAAAPADESWPPSVGAAPWSSAAAGAGSDDAEAWVHD